MPSVSILLPVRDALPWLGASLRSLARQSLTEHEIVAVDDGSTDGSGEALDRAAHADRRLRVVHEPARGLPAALNTALSLARAPLVARHDADDLSHRFRLERQLAHLRAHRGVAVVGCRLRLFPGARVFAGMRRWAEWHNALLTHEQMMDELLIDSPLAHGTAMVRRAWLERVGGWNEHGWPEDLDLWIRLAAANARFAKLPAVLYGWRQHAGSATRRDPRYRPERFLWLKRHALERGLLRDVRDATLVGVGRSIERWREALERSRRVRVVIAGRPHATLRRSLYPPVILVFGSRPARERWRHALNDWGMKERDQFIFVA
jgi:glycosyltransferase involved in cell wall biosynthesis